MKLKKPSKRPRIIKLYNDMYGFTVVFIVGKTPSQQEVGEVAKKYGLWDGQGNPPTAPAGRGATYQHGNRCLVWTPTPKLKGSSIAVLMHEMVHVISQLAAHTGQPMNKDTDEMHAYFAGWVVDSLLKKYFK